MINTIRLLLISMLSSSLLLAHGMPDNPLFLTTMSPTLSTVYVTGMSKSKKLSPKAEKRERIKQFISDNFESLQVEVAEGEGETLETLATFYDLHALKSWKSFLQEHYQEVFFLNKPKDSFGVYVYIDDITKRNFE